MNYGFVLRPYYMQGVVPLSVTVLMTDGFAEV